jgi:hypothetical protein
VKNQRKVVIPNIIPVVIVPIPAMITAIGARAPRLIENSVNDSLKKEHSETELDLLSDCVRGYFNLSCNVGLIGFNPIKGTSKNTNLIENNNEIPMVSGFRNSQ